VTASTDNLGAALGDAFMRVPAVIFVTAFEMFLRQPWLTFL